MKAVTVKCNHIERIESVPSGVEVTLHIAPCQSEDFVLNMVGLLKEYTDLLLLKDADTEDVFEEFSVKKLLKSMAISEIEEFLEKNS